MSGRKGEREKGRRGVKVKNGKCNAQWNKIYVEIGGIIYFIANGFLLTCFRTGKNQAIFKPIARIRSFFSH
jgi:hypothetical protein